MRREIRELSARQVREVFEYCGARGIERLSVSCNHAIQQSAGPGLATDEERRHLRSRAEVVMSNLYRVSVDGKRAGAVADWREISTSQVLSMMVVEFDRVDEVEIEKGLGGAGVDPDMPLEF